jgi:hypothetical protein
MRVLPAAVVAFTSHDRDYAAAGSAMSSALKAWKHTGFRRSGGVVRAASSEHSIATQVIAAISAEQPSSARGGRAKTEALDDVQSLDQAVAHEANAARAGHRRGFSTMRRELRLAKRLFGRAAASERAARADFKAAGVQIKPRLLVEPARE